MTGKEISKEDRAYFAGLLDGEGCISICKSKGKTKSIKYCLSINFGITYKHVLLEMKALFGGGITISNMKKRLNNESFKKAVVAGISSGKRKQSYNYYISGRDALYFLKVIEPFCREKKEQVALGIRYEQGKRPSACSSGRSERETERCEFFYQELQRMKHEQSDEIDNEVDFEDEQQKLFYFEVENE